MSWIPEQKMNPCPNPRCEKSTPPHVDFYRQGSRKLAGWCPCCGIWGPTTGTDDFEDIRVDNAVLSWNVAFPVDNTESKEVLWFVAERVVDTMENADQDEVDVALFELRKVVKQLRSGGGCKLVAQTVLSNTVGASTEAKFYTA